MDSQNQVAPVDQPQQPAVADFYFKCTVLACVLKASSCERNRKESSKSDALMLKKQASRCKGCKEWEAQQQATATSIADYHAGVTITEKKPMVSSINFERNRSSEWTSSGGGRHTRIN